MVLFGGAAHSWRGQALCNGEGSQWNGLVSRARAVGVTEWTGLQQQPEGVDCLRVPARSAIDAPNLHFLETAKKKPSSDARRLWDYVSVLLDRLKSS